jgi:serine/threonine-protein kinase
MTQRSPGPPRLVSEADTLAAARPAPGAAPPGIPASTNRPPSSTSASLDGGRFAPGAIVDARYRIIGLLGRGGMGEVYRAEDLRLGEPVALKFLPEKLVEDGAALARFHREVRTARLITHRNVVRVHDLGEVDGQPFLSMEYVDGEDLASLLRRIGRLPADKGLELARQLCAGLAAAHERGILHRDLKPGNVLIDGQGRAKITDFGLAALASDLEAPELAGTPAYMAPEQLGEGRVSYASDIYSLGLVLYEMFTGRRPFASEDSQQVLERLHRSDIPRMSAQVQGVDPQVEEVVLRCLRLEPERRPKSALDVAAALPGGDPLAAALAAGETPSPEMVAGAREAGTLSRPVGLGLLGLFVAGAAALLLAIGTTSAVRLAEPLAPEVLAHQAHAVLGLAGFEGSYRAWDYGYTEAALDELRHRTHDLEKWRALAAGRPGFVDYWYRESKRPLQPGQRFSWRVALDDPPAQTPGTATVTLDGQGRLRSLLVAPPIDGAETPPAAPQTSLAAPAGPEWTPYFDAAGLSPDAFSPVPPSHPPPIYADRLWAWTVPAGSDASQSRIEAATRDGRVVSWQVRDTPIVPSTRVLDDLPPIAYVVFALMWMGAGILAHRHLVSGSGDRRGAMRLGAFVATVAFIGPLLQAQPTALTAANFPILFAALAQGTMFGGIAWLLYMGLEPYARRVAPRWMVSWTRLLEGRFKDPMVGRDLLSGLAAIAAVNGVMAVVQRVLLFNGTGTIDWSYPHGLAALRGVPAILANLIHPITLLVPFGIMSVLILSRALIKRPLPAAVGAFIAVAAFDALFNGPSLIGLVRVGLVVGVGARWGLLALVAVAFFIVNFLLVPVSADPSVWWTKASWLGWGAVAALAFYGYRIATARPRTAINPGV